MITSLGNATMSEVSSLTSLTKEEKFLSEKIGTKPTTELPGMEQVHASKLRGKGIRKVPSYESR